MSDPTPLRAVDDETSTDGAWRMDEWQNLPDGCGIAGCLDPHPPDERGPMFTTDGAIHRLCTPHWEAVFNILGVQVSVVDDMNRAIESADPA